MMRIFAAQERHGPKREHPSRIGNATCGVSWCRQEVGKVEAGILLKGKTVDPPGS